MFSDRIYTFLDNALDFGISEADFWNMTFAELDRAIASKKRILKADQKQRAIFDYKLADLIGYSTARVHNSKNKMPSIEEMYPDLFLTQEVKEEIQKKKEELSVIRFIQFAQSHNQKYKDGEVIG